MTKSSGKIEPRELALQKFVRDHMTKSVGGTGYVFYAGYDSRDEEVKRLREAIEKWECDRKLVGPSGSGVMHGEHSEFCRKCAALKAGAHE